MENKTTLAGIGRFPEIIYDGYLMSICVILGVRHLIINNGNCYFY